MALTGLSAFQIQTDRFPFEALALQLGFATHPVYPCRQPLVHDPQQLVNLLLEPIVMLQTLIMIMVGQFANAQSKRVCCWRELLDGTESNGTCNDAWACCIHQVHLTEDA